MCVLVMPLQLIWMNHCMYTGDATKVYREESLDVCVLVKFLLKGTLEQNISNIRFAYWLVDDGLDMPGSIYDSVRAITASVVFFCVQIASIYYQ